MVPMKKTIVVLFILLSGCVSTSPYVPSIDLGIGHELPNRIIGDRGLTGIIRVQQPLVPDKVFLGYTHVSEIAGPDNGTLDQLEFFVRMPLRLER
jgi:hypothetical protein